MRETLLKLCRREDLTRAEARDAFGFIMSGVASEAQIGGLLVGLAAKGTTSEELIGAAQVMREKVLPIDCAQDDPAAGVILDTCGTGGTLRETFNISTAAAILAASCGVRVVKHGNRSASGRSGSADVLEKLGVKLELSPENLRNCLDGAGICFAFARSHHPAMKHVAAARSGLGIPTIFNVLGPLTNPGGAKHQLLGVFSAELTDRMATVLRELGSKRAWVVHAEDGLDELSTLGKTKVSELRNGDVRSWTFDPRDLGLPYARLSDLRVSGAEESADVVSRILIGELGPPRDIAALNAAAALVVAEKVDELKDGLAQVEEAIETGRARETLEKLVRLSHA